MRSNFADNAIVLGWIIGIALVLIGIGFALGRL